MKKIKLPNAPEPVGHYSSAIKAENFLEMKFGENIG